MPPTQAADGSFDYAPWIVATVTVDRPPAGPGFERAWDNVSWTSRSLGYVVDTSKVDDKTNPMHKPDQKCANCAQYQGKATDASAPCTIFAGKLVAGAGWCKVWVKKPA